MFKKISLYFTALVLVLTTIGSAYAVTLKASHQWPGTPRADGSFDVRHEMVQIIADEVKKANVDMDVRIYPAKSLYKPKEQWKPMTTGQLDISAFPLSLIHISEPTRRTPISYAVFCLKKEAIRGRSTGVAR
mgnify:CR=1 FL=1